MTRIEELAAAVLDGSARHADAAELAQWVTDAHATEAGAASAIRELFGRLDPSARGILLDALAALHRRRSPGSQAAAE